MPSIIGGLINMNIKEIQNTKEYKNDSGCCTLVSASVAFNMDYKKIYDFYMANGRKKHRGLAPFHTDRLLRKLAKQEGFKVTLFRPTFELNNLRKWVSGVDVWENGERSYPQFKPDNNETLTSAYKHITPNNQSEYLPINNYVMGVTGHVIGIKNGVVHDWTEGRKHQAKKIWRVEKTGKKVKCLTFTDNFNDLMNFEI